MALRMYMQYGIQNKLHLYYMNHMALRKYGTQNVCGTVKNEEEKNQRSGEN